ncbi:MAG: hypothetical protein HY040_17365 [Planctomycetes bacterium]|nr:hypothetical protein [Planctomycetota bacterium]
MPAPQLASHPMAPDGLDSPTVEYERGRLAREIPLSLHESATLNCHSMAIKRFLWALLPLFFAMIFAAVTVNMVKKNLVPSAVFGGVLSGFLFLWGLWLISKSLQMYSDRIDDLSICHTGLRWRKGEKQTLALWSDIAEVDVSSDTPRTGQTGLVGAMQAWSAATTINSVTIKLHSRETLVVRRDTVSDFVRFANTVKSRHEETLQEAKRSGGKSAFNRAFALP